MTGMQLMTDRAVHFGVTISVTVFNRGWPLNALWTHQLRVEEAHVDLFASVQCKEYIIFESESPLTLPCTLYIVLLVFSIGS